MNVLHRLPLILLLAGFIAAAPAAPAQTLSPVRYLPGDDVIGPAPGHQDEPAVARGGDRFLAVWRDYRTGGTDVFPDEGGGDIFATRLDAGGAVLDTTPIPISQDAAEQEKPAVAWNGTHWLVVWQTEAPTAFSDRAALRAVRVTPDGTVLDGAPIEVYTYGASATLAFALASDGNNWLVVTRGSSGGENDLLAIRVGPDGTVLDPAGVVLLPGTGTLIYSLGLAFAVDTYLLTYDLSGYRGQRLSTDLQLIGSPFFITGFYEPALSPASNGDGFFVAATDSDWGQLLGFRITRTGTVLDPGGRVIVSDVISGPYTPSVAWNGAAWTVTYWSWTFSNQYRLWAARMAPDGTALDPTGVFVHGSQPGGIGWAALAEAPGGGVQVVFEDARPSRSTFDRRSDVVTLRLSPTLQASPLTAAALGAPNHVGVDVAMREGGALAVFRSVRSDVERILAHPLDADGEPLLAEPVELAAGPWLSDPHVAWNGAVYLVTWSVGDARGDVVARRVAADGTPVDPAPVVLMEGFDPDVAALGDDFLVVGVQITTSEHIQEPRGVRVDGPTGAILDATPRDLGSNHTRAVSLTTVGNRWLLVYQRHPTHDNPSALIDGTLIESSGVATAVPFQEGGAQPAVASDGTSAFAVWHGADVRGRMVQPDGTLGTTITVSGAAGQQSDAAIGWDGEQYVALYEDLRNATSHIDRRSDVFGTRVDAAGTVVDPGGFAVFDDRLSEILPAVDGRDGVALLMASDFREASPYAAYRIAYRLLGEAAAPPVAVTAAPVGGPITIGPGGGSFDFTVTLTNTTAQAQSFQAWTAVTGPVGREPVMGPLSVTLPAGATLTRTLRQQVPGNAPAGSYTYHVRLGSFPSGITASDSFAFQKTGAEQAARGGAEGDGWPVSGWDEAASSAVLPEGFALSEAHPNPFNRASRLTLEVAEAQAVRAEVYDALGRRVAVLHEGLLEAGAHALVLDGSALPAGVYVVRVAGETFSATRRLTLVR